MTLTTIQPKEKSAFEGMIIYVGLDVHKKSWKVSIRFGKRELRTFSMNPDPKELKVHLEANYPGASFYTVYEAGFCGFHIHRSLIELGLNSIIVNPADIPTTDKDRRAKSDTRDSRKLAEALEQGSLKAIHVPTVEQEEFRAVYRHCEQIKKDKRRTMLRLRSHFALRGINLPDNAFSKKNIAFLREQASESSKGFIPLSLLDDYEYYLAKITTTRKEIKRLIIQMRRDEEIRIIETAPGIGTESATALVAEVIDPRRFINDNHLSSYCGLVPDTHSSGENEKAVGLTRRRKAKLRHILIEAAWIASKKDPELALAFNALCSRMKKSAAIIRIAEKTSASNQKGLDSNGTIPLECKYRKLTNTTNNELKLFLLIIEYMNSLFESDRYGALADLQLCPSLRPLTYKI